MNLKNVTSAVTNTSDSMWLASVVIRRLQEDGLWDDTWTQFCKPNEKRGIAFIGLNSERNAYRWWAGLHHWHGPRINLLKFLEDEQESTTRVSPRERHHLDAD